MLHLKPAFTARFRHLASTVLALSCAASAAAVDPSAATWPMYQGNASHTGYTPVSVAPGQFAMRWTRTFGPAPLNPATAADGKVFLTDSGYFGDHHLIVLDGGTGNTLWSQSYLGMNSTNPPSYENGVVYLQTGNHAHDTYLRAYNAATGELIYRSPHLAQWEHYYAPTLFDNKVYVNGGYYGGMYAFDAASGQQLWFRDLPQFDQWTPAVDDQYAYAYLGNSAANYNSGLYVIDRATGDLAFQIPDPGFDWYGWSMNLAPVLGDVNDAVVIHNGRLINFNLPERRIGWQVSNSFTGQPAIANHVIYSIEAGALSARDEGTGNRLWMWEPPHGGLSGNVLATDTHLFVTNGSVTYAVALASRRSEWSYPAGGMLCFSEGNLLIADYNGSVTAIAAVSGRMRVKSTKLHFNKAALGSSATRSLTIENTGTGGLTIQSISGLESPYQLAGPTLPATVPVGASLNLDITFSPTRKRRERKRITLTSNDPVHPQAKVLLDGTGVRRKRQR